MHSFWLRIYQFFGSNIFFWIVIGLFIFQALWLVVSAIYPMAFDEAYHFDLTRVYAGGWLPFLAEQPDVSGLNAVTRYPSYLFHYLMSFPYRLIALFTDNHILQIMLLRTINVGFFAGSLVVFRSVLRKLGLSAPLSHVSIALFTLIPIVPLLAAHINYDNLLILLVAWMFLLTIQIIERLRSGQLPLLPILTLGVVALFSTLVKYAVLPILLVICLGLASYLYLVYRGRWDQLGGHIKDSWRHISKPLQLIVVLALLLGGGLWFERYGVNLIQYQTIIPACDEVLSVEECMDFGPYERSVRYQEMADPAFQPDRLEHAKTWAGGMWYRLFFMINGDVPTDRYENFAPLPLPAITMSVTFIIGLAGALFYARRILHRRPALIILLAAALFYTAVLYINNYGSYAEHGRTAALNGRYLLIVLIPLIAYIGHGWNRILKGRIGLKVFIATTAILLSLQGGGLASFIARSSHTWYWPLPHIQEFNRSTQEAINPLIYGSDDERFDWVPH